MVVHRDGWNSVARAFYREYGSDEGGGIDYYVDGNIYLGVPVITLLCHLLHLGYGGFGVHENDASLTKPFEQSFLPQR